MTNFEGINPYEYQKQAVKKQAQRVEAQPHLKPQIEKANASAKPTEREAPKAPGGRPTSGAETKGYGRALATRAGVEVGKGLGSIAVETGKQIAKEVKRTISGRYEPKPMLRRKSQEPAPMQPRHEASRILKIRQELSNPTAYKNQTPSGKYLTRTGAA